MGGCRRSTPQEEVGVAGARTEPSPQTPIPHHRSSSHPCSFRSQTLSHEGRGSPRAAPRPSVPLLLSQPHGQSSRLHGSLEAVHRRQPLVKDS